MGFSEDTFRSAVITALRIDQKAYRPDMKMGDLDEWDSIAHLELIAELERQFGVSFTLDDMSELTSLETLRSRLQQG